MISVDEYLDQEAVAATRHWYYRDVVREMEGGLPGHAFLAANLMGELHEGLRGKGCRVAGSCLL